MAAINFTRDWFTPKDDDGNLFLATRNSRIQEALKCLGADDWIELEDGTRCKSEDDILNTL